MQMDRDATAASRTVAELSSAIKRRYSVTTSHSSSSGFCIRAAVRNQELSSERRTSVNQTKANFTFFQPVEHVDEGHASLSDDARV